VCCYKRKHQALENVLEPIQGVHFPMSILMNRSYCHGGRVDNIPFSASEMTDLSSDQACKFCPKSNSESEAKRTKIFEKIAKRSESEKKAKNSDK
jgi:hypothetical protein